jgi:type I restriction-modification system DNA methylase subunit
MHIEPYLKAVSGAGGVSEIAFYTPLVNHIFRGLLNYHPKSCLINKSGATGIPDIRILSEADQSEWIVCEAKLHDQDIRDDARRNKIWQEQIIGKRYISAETAYVVMCSPHAFQVFDPTGKFIAGVDLFPDRSELLDLHTQEVLPLDDRSFHQALDLVSARASEELVQYDSFRKGELQGSYIVLDQSTIQHLRPVFEMALRDLKAYCKDQLEVLKGDYLKAVARFAEVSEQLEMAGTEEQLLRRARNSERAIKRRHRVALQLFEEDYPQFKHDQAYAGTKEESHFEDIFVTNTAYIALTRLFFVRICEDIGLTTRKVSNEGPGLWARFVENIKHQYKDLLEVAFRDASHVYSHLFEATVFDWYGEGNGQLNRIFERILLRLNAFSFAQVDRDLLGTVYQYFRPRAERKRLGEYYTPDKVVDYILYRTGISTDADLMEKRILDPACGSFTFGVRAALPLLQAGQHLTARNRVALVRNCITGRDINPFSVFLAHLSLLFTMMDTYRAAKEEEPSFEVTGFDVANLNSLAADTGQIELAGLIDAEAPGITPGAFDYVVGNPPFVRNERIPAEDRGPLEEAYKELRSGNTDLATYFLDSALSRWLKDGGVLGMVAPIGQANARNADVLRQRLAGYTIEEIVSLEWMAKEVFPDADIIPMLLFIRKQQPKAGHRISVVTGLRTRDELVEAAADGAFREMHESHIDYQEWLKVSPTGDWPLDVTGRDMPILQKLSQGPRLSSAADAGYGIKLGAAGAGVAHVRGDAPLKGQEVPLAKGQHICAFGVSAPEEVIDLSRLKEVSDPTVWADLSFYKQNKGKRNETGLNGQTFASTSLLTEALPSDTLICLLPQVYTSLIACVLDPVLTAANNSVLTVVPRDCSAYVLSATMNSRICRYYAFLTMRAAILLRRRSTWYPRIVSNLPWPELTAETALKLHMLALEAASLSEAAQQTEMEAYEQAMPLLPSLTSAGFLKVYMDGPEERIEIDDLAAAEPIGSTVEVGKNTLYAPDSDTLLLVRMAAIAGGGQSLDNHSLQQLSVPAQPEDRARVAEAVRQVKRTLEAAQSRMDAIAEEIDIIVAAGLGLTVAEHEVIVQRCTEFPLNVTVGRPRYVWSPDRKVQARRIYEQGVRFR